MVIGNIVNVDKKALNFSAVKVNHSQGDGEKTIKKNTITK